ncbi:MAG: hypothetical protein M1833_001775 [Piccolia ochrophora]|nr:MAG: hypothetical protein M1833_001775 [Piccolia ochrophora]
MRFPWSSEPGRTATADRKAMSSMAPPQARPSPVVEIPVLSRFKRKWSDVDNAEPPRPDQKRKRKDPPKRKAQTVNGHDDLEGAMIERQLRSESSADSEGQRIEGHEDRDSRIPATETGTKAKGDSLLPVVPQATSLTPLQQTIEAQFSLEILLKHRELRLVEQELAKCQTALEQLRRCQLIPFPGSGLDSPYDAVDDPEGTEDEQAHGVESKWLTPIALTDGPYTRHYARWLIPDPKFDPDFAVPGALQEAAVPGKTIPDSRPTRANGTDSGSTAGKGRLRGAAATTNLQALPHGYPQSKDKAGPLVIKRTSDDQWVKLVCIDCSRGDFSSAQGFINHCRIAHHRGFESHDAAANVCGQVVDVDETGHVVGEGEAGGAPAALVHPLIRSAPTTHDVPMRPTKPPEKPERNQANENATRSSKDAPKPRAKRNGARTTKKTNNSRVKGEVKAAPGFVPSPQAPHLSALMEKRGLGGNLGDMVGEAKQKIDFGIESSDSGSDSENEVEDSSTTNTTRPSPDAPPSNISVRHNVHGQGQRTPLSGGRVPARSTMSPMPLTRPNSTKGFELHGAQRPHSRLSGTSTHPVNIPSGNLSPAQPSPTLLDPTIAPSLVSDDDEYDPQSEPEPSSPSSASAASSSASDDSSDSSSSPASSTPTSPAPAVAAAAAVDDSEVEDGTDDSSESESESDESTHPHTRSSTTTTVNPPSVPIETAKSKSKQRKPVLPPPKEQPKPVPKPKPKPKVAGPRTGLRARDGDGNAKRQKGVRHVTFVSPVRDGGGSERELVIERKGGGGSVRSKRGRPGRGR